MTQPIMKSLEYNVFIEGQEYRVRALIVSASEELILNNVDMEDNKGFIFKISVSTEPELPASIPYINKDFIYILGNGGDNRLGYINKDEFVELDEDRFLQLLEANALSVLLIAGDTGRYIV